MLFSEGPGISAAVRWMGRWVVGIDQGRPLLDFVVPGTQPGTFGGRNLFVQAAWLCLR